MYLVAKENILAARTMYFKRMLSLRDEVGKIVEHGIRLGEEHEEETAKDLDVIEEELQGMEDCLQVLSHLQAFHVLEKKDE